MTCAFAVMKSAFASASALIFVAAAAQSLVVLHDVLPVRVELHRALGEAGQIVLERRRGRGIGRRGVRGPDRAAATTAGGAACPHPAMIARTTTQRAMP